ncbi:hypothetical protein [Desulfocurvus vexinensis]|uniref:hypothetical protein n=1 Tax=Desulfocurvus vexinensis TaxID=399548 RepID=UPI00048D00B7|nr:hypothetical protein [Desulfocurvus vexinensis]
MSDITISGISTALGANLLSGDAKEWQDVEQKLTALLPGIDTQTLSAAITDYIEAHPSATPGEVLEAVVNQLNPGLAADQVAALRTEWEQFAATTTLDAASLLAVMKTPEEVVTPQSVRDLMAMLLMLMIEVMGEESASQLMEGFAQRDEIMALAKEKAAEMRAMAWTQLALGLTSAAISIVGGLAGMGFKDSSKAMLWSQVVAGSAKLFDTASQFATSMIQANIAEIEGKSQVAQIRKETAQKLEDLARDLVRTFMEIYNSLLQQQYQTMSKLSNV